ncbi:MAG TPA: hypothetical protein VK151_09630 [Fluviicola sp.]|nr:hypothetical protein [Fluviicola sp.]
MRNNFFTFLLIMAFSTAYSWSQSDTTNLKTYTLTGKIIEPVELTPHCGTIAWGTVIELEIEDYSDPAYTRKTIAVIVTCPEFKGEGFFQLGSRYEFQVSTRNPASFGWSIPNKDKLKKYPFAAELWVIDVKTLQ